MGHQQSHSHSQNAWMKEIYVFNIIIRWPDKNIISSFPVGIPNKHGIQASTLKAYVRRLMGVEKSDEKCEETRWRFIQHQHIDNEGQLWVNLFSCAEFSDINGVVKKVSRCKCVSIDLEDNHMLLLPPNRRPCIFVFRNCD